MSEQITLVLSRNEADLTREVLRDRSESMRGSEEDRKLCRVIIERINEEMAK